MSRQDILLCIGSRQDAPGSAADVEDAQHPERANGIILHLGLAKSNVESWRDILVRKAAVRRPVLEVEEDGVEAEEDEADGRREPAPGGILEGFWVDPHAHARPSIGLAEFVVGVGDGEEEGNDAGDADQGSVIADGVVEADFGEEEFEEDGIDEAG